MSDNGAVSRASRDSSLARGASELVLVALFAVGTAGVAAARVVEPELWVEARTRSFVVRSDAASERAGELAGTLEAFRAAFGGLAPEIELRSPVPTRILAFRDDESFGRFRRGDAPTEGRILGQFLTHPDGNFITINADPRWLGGVGVVLHEYVHYLVTHNFPGVPRWFNEGLAEYYSTFAIEGDRAVVGRPVERHLAWLRRNGRIDLAEILDSGDSERHFETDAGHFYAVSWGLVHYLLSSERSWGAKLATFLADSSDQQASTRFEDVFGVQLEDLEKDLERYLLAEPPRAGSVPLRGLVGSLEVSTAAAAPADVLNDLGALSLRLGDDATAGRFFNLALEYDPENGDAYAELANARDLHRRLEEADFLYSEAMARVPRDPRSYLFYGRHQLGRLEDAKRDGDQERVEARAREAIVAFRNAIDLMPDFAEAWALLGATHLFAGLDPGPGIAHLERSIELLPRRVDLYFHLLQLRLRAGDADEARRLAAGPVRRIGGEEWGLRADEEIERTLLLREADAALEEGRFQEGRELLEQAIRITSDPDLRYRLEASLERLDEGAERH